MLIEAYLGEGVISAPLSKYRDFHTRICRPVGLTPEDQNTIVGFVTQRIGLDYDVKNILDMLRFLVPLPIPVRWRRRMIAFGSGDPTRAICSTLIAQAFESVRYPILPKIEHVAKEGEQRVRGRAARREVLHIRHHSLYAPARFRHLALFRRGEADHPARFQIQEAELGRSTRRDGPATRNIRSPDAQRRRLIPVIAIRAS